VVRFWPFWRGSDVNSSITCRPFPNNRTNGIRSIRRADKSVFIVTLPDGRFLVGMDVLRKVSHAIDRVSGAVGRVTWWLTLAMVLFGAFNAVVRYLDRYTGWGLSSNVYIELQWYLFAAVFLLGAAYALREDAHVRVDVMYGRLSRKGRAWINVAGTVLFLIPFCVFALIQSIPTVSNSWAILEQSPDPGGLPRYPIKTLIPIAFVLLLVQGVSMLIKAFEDLRAPNPKDVGKGGAR
jgi:TRAP-type mannitol/chloroaromatic compound transport system permease small subunit